MAVSAMEATEEEQAPVTVTQAEQVQDIFAQSFSDPNMTPDQIMTEVVRLQNTIPVDLFYRLVELLEIDINTLPDHPAIMHLEEDDTVYVQNKIGVPEPVQTSPVKPAAKKAPPLMPQDRDPPVQEAGSTVPEQ
eukprot:5921790-Amphidinium_carterae.1